MKQVTIPAQWLQELIALCGPEDHELRERVMKSAATAPADALAVLPKWDKVRRDLTMVMLGFAGRPDCSESAAEAALDAVTEPGMPLAGLRQIATPQVQPGIDWDELPEDSKERARFNRDLDLLYSGDPRVSIATALSLWAAPSNGQFGLMCAIFANEVAKLHITPQAQADARNAVTFEQRMSDWQHGDALDAERYRWLRSRDLETISQGGVFAGMTPANIILNEEDLDQAVDAAIAAAKGQV